MRYDPLICVDPETSGVSPSRDRIVEIRVVTIDAERIAHSSTLRARDPQPIAMLGGHGQRGEFDRRGAHVAA